MITKIAFFLCVLAISSNASVIDQGAIPGTWNTDGVGDADSWDVTLSSTGGNFAVTFTEEGITASPGCSLAVGCPAGTVTRILAFSLDVNYGAQGSGTIGGIWYPALVFGGGHPDMPHTRLTLTTEPFTVTAPGPLVVPFAMTGRLEASLGFGYPQLLDEAITGTGVATVFVSTDGENLYPRRITYVFTPVPEPATWPLAALSLAAIGTKLCSSRLKMSCTDRE